MTTELEHKAARERRYDLRTPIIRAIYDVCQAIEECGASEKLTHAVTLAGALMEPVRVLLEERDALAAPVPAREDEVRLRAMLASCYAGVLLYADDGELQDCRERPFIDFKRDSVDEIDEKMMQ